MIAYDSKDENEDEDDEGTLLKTLEKLHENNKSVNFNDQMHTSQNIINSIVEAFS